jgi:hypothetical protein
MYDKNSATKNRCTTKKKQMKLVERYDSTLTKPNLLYDKKVIDAVKVRPHFAHSKFSCASQKRRCASKKGMIGEQKVHKERGGVRAEKTGRDPTTTTHHQLTTHIL